MSAKTRELASAYKFLEKDPGNSGVREQIAQMQEELSHIGDALRAESRTQDEYLKAEYGIDDDFLRAFEAADTPTFGSHYWHSQIQQVPTTHRLEDTVAHECERLLALVDQAWLREQAQFQYRQNYGSHPSDCRLHIVGRQRLLSADAPARPKRMVMVEDTVRTKSGQPPTAFGANLMRTAFTQPGGRLTHPDAQNQGQYDALLNLFLGTNGWYRNPIAHGPVGYSDPHQVAQILGLANLLFGPGGQMRVGRSTMRYGSTMTFRRIDGSTVKAREFYIKPTDQLAEGLITDDGRVIYRRDEEAMLFWFKDTQEQLHLVADKLNTELGR